MEDLKDIGCKETEDNRPIGLVTWAMVKNYGTNLQAYALQKVLKQMGYDCVLIKRFKSGKFSVAMNCVLRLNNIFLRKLPHFRGFNNNYRRFFDRYLNTTVPVTKKEQKETECQKYRCIVTGSDQIWNPYHLITYFMLDFYKGENCFAYSTSIGMNSIPEEKKALYREQLSKFHAFGMREQVGVDSIKQLFPDKSAIKVVDPVQLLTEDEWREFSSKASINFKIPNEYVFCYLVGNRDEYKENVARIWQTTGYSSLICIQSAENPNLRIDGAINYSEGGPIEFVWLLLNAKLIITDSFHATAISINSHKNFVEFIRFDKNDVKSQNSRIFELLSTYDLSGRFYSEKMNLFEDINYSSVEKILEQNVDLSMRYLKDSIEWKKP